VLVTGHTGFKGAWLSLWLQSLGARVIGLARGKIGHPSLYAVADVGSHSSERHGDVREFEAVHRAVVEERPEVIFHLAAQPVVRRSLREPRGTYETNVMGTVNVLESVRCSRGVQAVVVVTSDKCYENPQDGQPHRFVESDPMGGRDPYSSSKGCAELVCAAYRSSFFAEGDAPRVATARAGNVIGGGDWGEDRLVPDAIRAARAGAVVRLRNPDAVRPWQHVLNPLSGYLLLAQALAGARETGGGWNFGPRGPESRSVREIVRRLVDLWPDPLRWELDSAENPPEATYLSLDSSKAETRLGWQPGWDVDEALMRVVEWHDAQRRGDDMRRASMAQIAAFAMSGGA